MGSSGHQGVLGRAAGGDAADAEQGGGRRVHLQRGEGIHAQQDHSGGHLVLLTAQRLIEPGGLQGWAVVEVQPHAPVGERGRRCGAGGSAAIPYEPAVGPVARVQDVSVPLEGDRTGEAVDLQRQDRGTGSRPAAVARPGR